MARRDLPANAIISEMSRRTPHVLPLPLREQVLDQFWHPQSEGRFTSLLMRRDPRPTTHDLPPRPNVRGAAKGNHRLMQTNDLRTFCSNLCAKVHEDVWSVPFLQILECLGTKPQWSKIDAPYPPSCPLSLCPASPLGARAISPIYHWRGQLWIWHIQVRVSKEIASATGEKEYG